VKKSALILSATPLLPISLKAAQTYVLYSKCWDTNLSPLQKFIPIWTMTTSSRLLLIFIQEARKVNGLKVPDFRQQKEEKRVGNGHLTVGKKIGCKTLEARCKLSKPFL